MEVGCREYADNISFTIRYLSRLSKTGEPTVAACPGTTERTSDSSRPYPAPQTPNRKRPATSALPPTADIQLDLLQRCADER